MTAIYGAFNNDESRVGRMLTAAAHLMLYGVALNAVRLIVGMFVGDHWLLDLAEIVSVGVVVIGIFHNRLTRLCVRCMQEVPADAGFRAERQRWILWINHFMESWRNVLLVIGADIAVAEAITNLGLSPLARLPFTFFFCILFPYSIWLHHRLRPWCQYCRDWDEGGDHEHVPDPVRTATR